MGTHGSPPTRVPEVPVKWTRPARSPADLQVGPVTLSIILVTLGRPWTALSRSWETYRACGARFSLNHGGGAANRSEDRGILSAITEGDLPKSVTDPDEGPPTSNGNSSPPAI
jgi:hypothetical protein